MNKEINLKVTVEQVYELIAMLDTQAYAQLKEIEMQDTEK